MASHPAPPAADEVIENVVAIVNRLPGEIVFATCIDQYGSPQDTQCFASPTEHKTSLPAEEILGFAREQGSAGVIVVTNAAGSLGALSDADTIFTLDLIEAGRRMGVEVHDHIIVKDGESRGLRASTDLWND